MSERRNTSLVNIALTGLARAPRRSKLGLLANVLLLGGVAAVALMDVSSDEGDAARFAGIALLMGGALLMSVATVLWSLSQEGQCGFFDLKREALRLRGMRTRKLDEVLIAFPVIAFAAGCIMSAGMSILATELDRPLARFMLAGMAAWFFAWTVAMIGSTTRFMYGHAREQAEAAERARGEATEAQLAALQAQMNPHFLFNTLNTVASLVRTDAVAAEATVENLALVLRRTLDRSRSVLSTVDDELDHLAAYLSVAKQRFEDRLQVHWAVDPEARPMMMPTMTLQPLVENSLKHGLGARLEGGALHIGVQLESADASDVSPEGRGAGGAAQTGAPDDATLRLVIEVADDGPGFARRYVEGTGLSNLRARLATLYGDAAALHVDREAAAGARVIVTLPVVRSAAKIPGASAAAARGEPVAVHEV